MAGKHGLGRGLSSLIPQNKTNAAIPSRGQSPRASADSSRDIPLRDMRSTTRDKTPENAPQEKKTTPAAEQAQAVDSTQKQLAVIGVAVGDISANAQQPRKYFDDGKLAELADSIKEHGIMQPLVVVAKGSTYELIAGERRLRAAKIAGLSKVPVIVRGDLDEQKKLELAIIENVQRHDLNVIEEGKSYKKLIDDFHLTQEDVAKKMGKSRSVIANRVRLAGLPVEIQRALIDGKISEGHAKVILSLESDEKRRALFEIIISGRLSVRDAEKALGTAKSGSRVAGHVRGAKTPNERMLEDQLTAYFGTKVDVKQKARGGSITLNYFSQDELKNVLGKLKLS